MVYNSGMEFDADKEWEYGNRIIKATYNLLEAYCVQNTLSQCKFKNPSFVFMWSANAQEQLGAEVMAIVRKEMADLLKELRDGE